MSLLNQVLQDLDERAPAGQPRSVHLTVAPETASHTDDQDERGTDWLRLATGILVVALFVAAVWIFYPSGDDSLSGVSAEALPVVSVTETATGVGDAARQEPVPMRVDTKAAGASGRALTQLGAVVPAVSETSPGTEVPAPAEDKEVPSIASSPAEPFVSSSHIVSEVNDDANIVAETREEVTYLALRNTEIPVVGENARAETRSAGAVRHVKTRKSDVMGATQQARLAIEQGELSSAESLLRQGLVQAPDDRDARELLVGLMLRGGRYDAAMQQLDQGLAHYPGYVKFVLIKARLLAQQGESEAAIGVLESSAPSDSGRVEWLQMLGALYQQQARYAAAVDSYRSLLSINENLGSSWVGLAISLDGMGDPNALQAYRRALRLGRLPVAAESYARQRIGQLESRVD